MTPHPELLTSLAQDPDLKSKLTSFLQHKVPPSDSNPRAVPVSHRIVPESASLDSGSALKVIRTSPGERWDSFLFSCLLPWSTILHLNLFLLFGCNHIISLIIHIQEASSIRRAYFLIRGNSLQLLCSSGCGYLKFLL